MEDTEKYNGMEAVLQKINKDFLSLSEEDEKTNKDILKSLVTQISGTMAQKDSLFKEMSYGGSSYDVLKVGHPDEYDLNLLLKLPRELEFKLEVARNVPGSVLLKFSNYIPSIKKLDLTGKHKGLDKLINTNRCLDKFQVLQWIQSLIQQAVNCLKTDRNGYYIFETPNGIFNAKVIQSETAFAVKVTGTVKGKQVNMDLDLVPCFVFSKEQWPRPGGFRKDPVGQKPTFFIVPKPFKGMENYSDRNWRLSFQEQERELLDEKATLNLTIKLLKKMRDRQHHKRIASYHIKTVALWTLDQKGPGFWNDNSLSFAFMTVLKNYQTSLETRKMPYYWNKDYNLLEKVHKYTLVKISNQIKVVINDIERHLDDPLVIAKYILKPPSVLTLKNQFGPE